ncbi:MAG: energy-coupling factor ABC transporter permease, partial [Chloroflexota bacterium]
AIVTVSMSLIIQALFFGDGGILAIFINCLNMAIILPLVGYGVYRLIAGRSPILSNRRVWAAGIGAYVGITASALAVGIELGLQPLLFSNAGIPSYSPYGLAQSIPAMLISHVFGASAVEAIITSLGVAYMQKRYPEYLTSLRSVFAGPGVVEGRQVGRPIWQILAMGAAALMASLFVLGFISGGFDIGHMFGADWSKVSWADVGSMLLVVLVIAIVLIPLTYFLLPKRFKGVGTAFMAAAIVAPLGLIAPGFAFGEGSTDDVRAAFGYIPKGLQDLSTWFSALFSGYNIKLPFFSDSNAALWQTAIGYEISGIIGMLVVGLAVFGVTYLLRRRSPTIHDEDKAPVGVGASPSRKGTQV